MQKLPQNEIGLLLHDRGSYLELTYGGHSQLPSTLSTSTTDFDSNIRVTQSELIFNSRGRTLYAKTSLNKATLNYQNEQQKADILNEIDELLERRKVIPSSSTFFKFNDNYYFGFYNAQLKTYSFLKIED